MTWIFGYGSLIFRPGFPHEETRVGCVEGFVRRFWQGSTDHRGVPKAPGRVVTLVPETGARCFGVAYRLREADAPEILAALDHREKGGYVREEHRLMEDGGAGPSVLVYRATAENPNYLGPAPLGDMARQIATAVGPSGKNLDYLLRLAGALEELGAPDPHVTQLAKAATAIGSRLPRR